MKQKTHSGLKKRVKVRRSGSVSVQKSCKNHLLDNKSKRQKKSFKTGMPISSSRMQSLRRLMPGKVGLRNTRPGQVTEENRKSAGATGSRPLKATGENKRSSGGATSAKPSTGGKPAQATEANKRKSAPKGNEKPQQATDENKK